MAPSFLIVGATGNTGRGTVRTLSQLISSSDTFANHKILAITRSKSGAAAQQLAKLPGVEVIEQQWVDIDADWLREREVVRLFVATSPSPAQFSEESALYVHALHAGVQYLVRISTTAPNVRPDTLAYYARSHWALEALLSTPEFEKLHWSALQPNAFTAFYLYAAAELVKEHRKTGKQSTLRLTAAEDVPVAPIDADDVGATAARLLVEKDTARHNKARYVLNGPVDITGRQIVELVEKKIGTKVEDVSFKDMSFVEYVAMGTPEHKHLTLTIRYASEKMWLGETTAAHTSKEILQLSPPQGKPEEIFETLIGGESQGFPL